MSLVCQVFRSPRRDETYLFVERGRGLSDVPAALLDTFGEPQEVMVLVLGPGRRLARADTAEVIRHIRERGYYLQLPPVPGALARESLDDTGH